MNKTKFAFWALVLIGILAYKDVADNSGYERPSSAVYQSTSRER